MDFEMILKNLSFVSFSWQLITPLLFMICDVISGVIQAIINNDLDSKIMRQGLLRKGQILLVLFLSIILEHAFGITAISKTIAIYIVVMELISILENVQKSGVDLGKLGELLKSPEQKENEEKEEK